MSKNVQLMITRAWSGYLGACQACAVDNFACATQKLRTKTNNKVNLHHQDKDGIDTIKAF